MSTNELAPDFQKLIETYQNSFATEVGTEASVALHVDEVASAVAALYEKLRMIVDWKEEHLIRRTAIERVLKRRMLSKLSGFSSLVSNLKAAEIAEPLVVELVRGGHFPNDSLPREKIDEVGRVLGKYIYLLENNPLAVNHSANIKDRVNLYSWILEIAACELEEVLAPPVRQLALINFMAEVMTAQTRASSSLGISEEERQTQIYIAVHRTLLHLDAPIISYHLLQRRYPGWSRLDTTQLAGLAPEIPAVWREIEGDLAHSQTERFFKLCEKHDTLFLLLGDVLEDFAEAPEAVSERVADPQILANLVKAAYDKRLTTLKSRLFRMAIYSTLSIFVAGGFSLFVVEVPLARLFYGRFSVLAMIVDLLLPTVVMFLLVTSVRLPQESNLEAAVEGIQRLVYPGERRDVFELRPARRRSAAARAAIYFLYLVSSVLSLGLVTAAFYYARIPATSIVLDAFNVAVVVFAGLVIRQRAKELTVEEERVNVLEFFLDVLSIPVAKVGKWLSQKWKEYNVVSVLFAALIDAPFLTFIEMIEGWSVYVV